MSTIFTQGDGRFHAELSSAGVLFFPGPYVADGPPRSDTFLRLSHGEAHELAINLLQKLYTNLRDELHFGRQERPIVASTTEKPRLANAASQPQQTVLSDKDRERFSQLYKRIVPFFMTPHPDRGRETMRDVFFDCYAAFGRLPGVPSLEAYGPEIVEAARCEQTMLDHAQRSRITGPPLEA